MAVIQVGSYKNIGIIGGSELSELSNPEILKNATKKKVETPFGEPSDVLKIGEIGEVPCVLLSRHGRGHSIMPTNVNYRANLFALRQEGCTHILATTACGSLQEEFRPGNIIILDQFIDRTQKRIQTFFDGQHTDLFPGICHLPLAEPFCTRTSKILYECSQEEKLSSSPDGTMLTIEGPRFSSKAESKLWHSWGAHCVNMTTVPEVILAKELGLSYASLGLVTDYDSWRTHGESVSVEGVIRIFQANARNAQILLKRAIPKIAQQDWTETFKSNRDTVKDNTLISHS